MVETVPDQFVRRESLTGLFILGVVLIPVGMVLFNAGRTAMACTEQATGRPGIMEIWRQGQLILTDGCNFYEIPFLSIFGAILVALTVGYVALSRARDLMR